MKKRAEKRLKYPSISIVIPFYNEEENLQILFKSLKKQNYPIEKIEYIAIDDSSTDRSLDIAKKFGCRILKVATHDIELNKGIGLHAAKNELVYWLDADMEICCDDFFLRLTKPLIDNPKIGASFTVEFSLDGCGNKKVKSSILRFISYHPLQQDPLYAFFSKSIESTFVEKKSDYYLCKFIPGKIPAAGRVLYRRKELLATEVGKSKPFIDMESLEIYTRAGHNLYAYVPQAKIRHFHAESLKELITKRLRNLERDYLPNLEHKYFLWINPKDKKDILKVIFWVIYANLFIPELIRGIIKMIRYRDIVFLWHPVVSITTTDAIIWGFLSKSNGRKFARTLFKNVLGI